MVLNVGRIIKASKARLHKAQCAEAMRAGVYGKAETLSQFKQILKFQSQIRHAHSKGFDPTPSTTN